MSSAPLARSAGPRLTRTLSNMLTSAPPLVSPQPHQLAFAPFSPAIDPPTRRTPGARRPTAPELSARLSTAHARFEARQCTPLALSSSGVSHASIFSHNPRAASGLGFFLPLPSPGLADTLSSAEASPGLHAFLYNPAYPLAAAAAAAAVASPSRPQLSARRSRRASSPVAPDVIYSTPPPRTQHSVRDSPATGEYTRKYAVFTPGPRYVSSPLATHAWNVDADAAQAFSSSSRTSGEITFPRTPGHPILKAGASTQDSWEDGEQDPEDAYYMLPSWLLESGPAGGDDYFTQEGSVDK